MAVIECPDFVISRMIWSLSMALPGATRRWLSLTPEPERLLPEARAVLRSGAAPPPRGRWSERERAVAERLVLRARRDALGGVAARERGARRRRAGRTEAAGALVRDVVANHDALALGLPGAERHREQEPMTTTAVPDTRPGRVAERARRFVDEELIPREVAAELAGGRLPAEEVAAVRAAALAAGLNGGLHARRARRPGLVAHDVGARRGAARPLDQRHLVAHPERLQRLVGGDRASRSTAGCGRCCAARRQDAYAVTEEHAGSDPSGIATIAEPLGDGGGWRIRGEKWFVTSGDVADVLIVVAVAPEGPTLFLVPADARRDQVVEDPPYTHAYPHGHPTLRFDVEVGPDAVLGPLGGADELQRAWFIEERLGIAARGIGAMERLLEDTLAWATGREQGGARLWDHQGVSFPLADSAADAPAGRLLVLEVARLADAGADPKLVHAKASMAKLFVSEAACRCADRAVQAFGGRGYRRDNVAERFLRELRVDRIWEGTSEIQRLIIARSLERRGVAKVLR